MDSAQHILKTYWNFDAFRDLQEEIIHTVLEGKDCIALLPTGGGKSLCYQVPALMLDGLTIVVTPLVSLMQDQVAQLKLRGIKAEYLHSGLRYAAVETLLAVAESGEIKLLYVSPERLQSRQFRDALPYLNVGLIAVDEAHCISQWGHDFRPEFLQVNSLREVWKNTPLIAVTASATQEVLQDIQVQLKLEAAPVFRKSFDRENILYDIQQCDNKHEYIVRHFLKQQHCGIIYCRSRKRTEELALLLQQNHINAAAYHAGMLKEARNQVQESWMQDRVAVMVATTAFGMGIDKPDVRTVIHFDAPEHLEAYYQETGRAGRDGKEAVAISLYNKSDIDKLQQSTALYFPPGDYLKKVYQCVCDFLQIPTGVEPNEYFDFDLSRFLTNFRLEAVPASHALRLLAQEGLWSLSESLFRPATVQFLTDRQVLDDINERYPMLALVSTGLLRLFSGIFHYPGTINLFSLSRHLYMKKEDVEQSLLQLHRMNIIDYQPAKEGPQLYFHHYRVPSKELLLNFKRINRLRDNHQRRTDIMIRFLTNKTGCFNKILLEYFDEQTKDHCGHCIYCLDKKQLNIKPKDVEDAIKAVLGTQQQLQLNTLLSLLHTPVAESVRVIRSMIDEGLLLLDEEGKLSIK